MVKIGFDMHLWSAPFLLPFVSYITGMVHDTYWAAGQLGTMQGMVSALARCLLGIGCYVVALKMLLYAYEKSISGYRIQVAEQQVEVELERYRTLTEHMRRRLVSAMIGVIICLSSALLSSKAIYRGMPNR